MPRANRNLRKPALERVSLDDTMPQSTHMKRLLERQNEKWGHSPDSTPNGLPPARKRRKRACDSESTGNDAATD